MKFNTGFFVSFCGLIAGACFVYISQTYTPMVGVSDNFNSFIEMQWVMGAPTIVYSLFFMFRSQRTTNKE